MYKEMNPARGRSRKQISSLIIYLVGFSMIIMALNRAGSIDFSHILIWVTDLYFKKLLEKR